MAARRTRRELPGPDWLGPYRCERDRAGGAGPGNPQWTAVGCLGSERRALVDPRGLVTPVPGGWSVDWWVRAADRWHLPARESATRHALMEGTPVVETVMRIPGGDVALRVYAVPGPPPLAVAEVENRSDVPVAVAFAIRPYHPAGGAPVHRITTEGTTVVVDGRPGLFLPRAPAGACASTGPGGDCARSLTEGEATGGWPFEAVHDAHGLAQAAFVYPLPHTKAIRVAMPISPRRRRGLWGRQRARFAAAPDLGRLPDAGDVVRGWQAQLGRGMRLELPDAVLAAAVDANRAFALLFGEVQASERIRSALALYGLAGPAAATGPPGRKLGGSSEPIATWRRVRELLRSAGPTYTWPAGDNGHDPDTAAEFLAAVRSLLVREEPGPGAALTVCPLYPPEWSGRPVEVHDAPTEMGRVSFALRWHGDRPALLWACERPGIHLTAPGLDPSWSSTERAGEALLAPFRGRVSIPLAEQD